MPVMHGEFCRVLLMPRPTELAAFSDFLKSHPDTRSRIESVRNLSRQCEIAGSRFCLQKLLFSVDPSLTYRENPPKAPELSGKNLYCSITHTQDFVAAALATSPVAIDAETIRLRKNLAGIADRVIYPGWFESLPPESRTDAFFRAWGVYECGIKLNARLEVTPALALSLNGTPVNILHRRIDRTMLTLASIADNTPAIDITDAPFLSRN